ncbi:hypothetical protein ACFX11_027912 [Malus domestica]
MPSYPLKKALAPTSFLLQFETENFVPSSQVPFQRKGTGEMPVSWKLTCSGQIPVSTKPMITSEAKLEALQSPLPFCKPRN